MVLGHQPIDPLHDGVRVPGRNDEAGARCAKFGRRCPVRTDCGEDRSAARETCDRLMTDLVADLRVIR